MTVSVPAVFFSDVFEALQGERLLWGARPQCWGYAHAKLWRALFAVGFAGCWLLLVALRSDFSISTRSLAEEIFPLFVILACLTPVIDLFVTLRKSRRVYYAVGERHAVIVERGQPSNVRLFDLQHLAYFEVKSRRGNRGDIVLDKIRWNARGRPDWIDEGFLGLADLASAKGAINEARAALN